MNSIRVASEVAGMYTEFFSGWGGGGGGGKLFFYIYVILFLFSDVEHSCLPGSLNDLVRIKKKILIQFKSNYIELVQLLEWEGLCSSWGESQIPE